MKYVDFFFRKSVDTKNWQKFYTCWYGKLIVVSKKKKKKHKVFFWCISSFFRCATFTIGLSTGWSESSLCPTWHRPDRIGSPKPGPATDNSDSGGWMSAVRQSGIVRFWFCRNRHQISLKSLVFARSDRISMRLGRILKRSWKISTRSG